MNFKRTLGNLALSGLLLAGVILAYADGEVVKLTNGDSISWAEFVDAINNPKTATGEVDPTSIVAVAWKNAQSNLIAKEEALTSAQAELTTANDNLNGNEEKGIKSAATLLAEAKTQYTEAQKAYTAANNAYNTALGDQSVARDSVNSRDKQLTQAQQKVTEMIAAISKTYDDQITAKQNQISSNNTTNIPNAEKERDRYLRLRNALVKKVAKKVTAPWLVSAQENYAPAIRNSFKPNGATTSLLLYYKAEVNQEYDYDVNDTPIPITTVTLWISFEPQGGWYFKTINEAFTYIRTQYPDIQNTTIINTVKINFGKTGDKYNYGSNGILTITPEIKYSSVNTKIATAIEEINPANYQTDSTTEFEEVISDQELYKEYDDSYKEYKTLAETTLPNQNSTLVGEINDLQAEKATAIGENTSNDELKALRKYASDVNGYLESWQGKYDTATTTVNKYRATSYMDEDGETIECTDADGNAISYLTWLSNQQTEAQNAQADAQDNLTKYQNAYNAASTKVTNAENAYETAQSTYNTAKANYDEAQKEADAAATAAAQDKYNEITLTAGTVISATEPITKAYSGTINGNGAIINVNIEVTESNTQTALFKTFSGHVNNAAINGTFGQNLINSSFANVVRWDGNGKIYSENGTPTEYNSNELENAFGAFGFALRNNQNYGVDFNTGLIVKMDDAPSKVFKLTEYDVPADGDAPVETVVYVQLYEKGSADMITRDNNAKTSYSVPENRFAKSATDAVKGLGLTNVYYGENNICELAVIKDRVNFYCPETVKAQKIDFSREFNKGYNSVCVPFQLNTNMSTEIASICEYESVDLTNKKFWFKQNASTVPANTPVLIVMKDDAKDVKFAINDVVIAATDKSQLVSAKAMNDNTCSHGTLKPAHASEFEGMQYVNNIYGLKADGNFIVAGETAVFPALRMVIGTRDALYSKNAAKRAPGQFDVMGIGIHDEDGHDITDTLTTGINDVVSDSEVASFSIVGGQGEIIINSEADYGEVAIYTIDGSVVAIADVIEGTTNVNVQKGLYIVMGKKVMVK